MLFSSTFYSSLKSAIPGTHVVIALHPHIRQCSSFNQPQVTGALFSCSIVIKIHCQHGGETIRKNRKKAKSFSGWVWTSSTLHSLLSTPNSNCSYCWSCNYEETSHFYALKRPLRAAFITPYSSLCFTNILKTLFCFDADNIQYSLLTEITLSSKNTIVTFY